MILDKNIANDFFIYYNYDVKYLHTNIGADLL